MMYLADFFNIIIDAEILFFRLISFYILFIEYRLKRAFYFFQCQLINLILCQSIRKHILQGYLFRPRSATCSRTL